MNMRTLSLKTKVSGIVIASTVLLTTTLVIFYLRGQIIDMQEDDERGIIEAVKSASVLAFTVVPHFVDNDYTFMNDLVSHYRKHAYYVYVDIVDVNDRIMADSEGLEIGGTLNIPAPLDTFTIGGGTVRKYRYTAGGKEFIDITYPIKAGDLVLGAVRIGLNTDWMSIEQARLEKTILFSLALASVIVVSGVLLASWLVNKTVVPILSLKEAAEKVGKGDYTQSVKVESRDEVGTLAGSFNKMVEDLRNAGAQLVEKKYVDLIIDNMHDALIVTDPEGLIRTVNRTALKVSGYDENELIHQPFHLIFPEATAGGKVFSAIWERGFIDNVEKSLLAKDGRRIQVLLSCSVMAEAGTLGSIVCVARDITLLKRTEENLKLFSQALERALDGVNIVDMDGRIIYSNNAAGETMGYSVDEMIGKHIDDLNVDSEFSKRVVIPSIRETGRWNGELMRRHRDGHIVPVWLSASIIKDDGGEPVAMLGIMRDITDRKRAEDLLKAALARTNEEKAKSEAIISAIGDSLVITDTEFRIVYQNHIDRELVGNHIGEVCYEAFEGRDRICEDCLAVLSVKDGRIHRGERIAVTNQGTKYLDITASPLRDSSGDIIAVIEVIRDITERKRAEEALRKTQENLETLVEERTVELTMMNEQLRNFSTYLQEARENERTSIAREIHDELGQSLTALKMDLSLLTKRLPKDRRSVMEKAESMASLIESTIQSVKRISTELRPGLLDHLGLTAAIEWQAEEFKKRTDIACNVVFEPEEIVVDRNRSTTIFRIFQETLTNVARHAKATKVTVLLKKQDKELSLDVTDNGEGITREQMTDAKSLGLIGMRERVHAWGGSFEISGAKAAGTTVTVHIPLDGLGEAS